MPGFARFRTAALVAAAASVPCLGGCDEPNTPGAPTAAGTSSFVVGDSVYHVGPVLSRNAQVELFGAYDIAGTGEGYLLTDSRNGRLMLYDRELALVREIGREGSGPGEYRFPAAMASDGDRIAVLDQNLARVSYLTPAGKFISSQPMRANSVDIALHPRLGLLVAEDASPVHYLSRYAGGESTAFAEMPSWLADDAGRAFRLRTDLVAASPDGSVHVLDGRRLVLVSYAESGALRRAAFLPDLMRREKLDRQQGLVDGLGGPGRVLSVQTASQLQPLPDGRLFVRITWGRMIGYVLDPKSLEAVPVAVPSRRGLDWMLGSRVYLEAKPHPRIFAALDEEILIARLVLTSES